jgi:hypothetical protein
MAVVYSIVWRSGGDGVSSADCGGGDDKEVSVSTVGTGGRFTVSPTEGGGGAAMLH